MRLVLKADNSGKIYTRSLVAEDVRSALASGSTGADWEHHAQIVFGRGGFKAIGDLKLEEIGFELASADRGFSILTVTLPRGPEMRWPAALTSRQAAMRLKAGETLKPDSASAVGDRIELSIEFPTDVISQGVRLRARGVDGSHEREIAKLVVTADAAQVEGEDLVWIITW